VVAVVLAVLVAASAYAQTTDFFELAKTGTSEQIQAAIDKGANANAVVPRGEEETMGKTPLMYAAKFNTNPEVITVLLKAGADVNAVDALHSNALIWAAGIQNPDVITALLKAALTSRQRQLTVRLPYA